MPTPTNQQCGISDEVRTSTTHNTFDAKFFLIQSCSGCGKPYLNNLLLASVRSKGYHAAAVASSKIASLLLDDGTTGNTVFGILVTKGGASLITLESNCSSCLRDCNVIVRDEGPMAENVVACVWWMSFYATSCVKLIMHFMWCLSAVGAW